MIDALVFDFDGVIIDTETPEYICWQEVFRSHGVGLDRSLWSRFIGGGSKVFDVCHHLEELIGVGVDREAIRRRKHKRHIELTDQNPLLPGVLDHILEAKRIGLKLGMASSSPRAWVERHLERRGLLVRFDACTTE